MLVALGAMTLAAGLFLFLWYRTVVGLPVRRQPLFIHSAGFKWGMPLAAAVVLVLGIVLLASIRWQAASAGAAGAALLAFLVLKFDRYTAEIRSIYDHYRKVRAANPAMEEFEVLLHTAEWRYPRWSEDRLVELVAEKDIAGLILLILIKDNEVNPISDWDLYRALRLKVDRIGGKGRAENRRR